MEQLAKDIYLETSYEGINVGALITTTGVICVDTPSYARDARDWAARLHRLSPYPIQQIILTNSHGDRVLHTRWLNAPIMAQQHAAELLQSYDKKYPQAMIDSLSLRNPHRTRELNNGPVERPTMSFSDEIIYYRSGHEINLISAPGPARDNCWVALPRTGIIFTGDSLVVDTHPCLSAPVSAEWLRNLEKLSGMRRFHTIVPGRGPLAQQSDIDRLVDYLETMRARVAEHIAADRPREALGVLVADFIGRYPLGTLPADWVSEQIETSLGLIYDELTGRETPQPVVIEESDDSLD